MEPSRFDERPVPPADREVSVRRIFHVSTGMLVIAVIALCLGVYREAAGLGILLGLLVFPALARTFVAAARRPSEWSTMSGIEKTAAFVGSLGIVAFIGLAASIAFVATCFPTGLLALSTMGSNPTVGLGVAGAVGITAAGFVFFYLGRRYWPRKES